MSQAPDTVNRRTFLATAAALPAVQPPPDAAPWTPLRLVRHDVPLRARSFPMTAVRLSAGPFKDAQEVNSKYLHRLDADRLLHTFRLTAGLPSSAAPLGGWEKPDGELRGHFTGHFLTACALAYSSTGDVELKRKAEYIVAELAKCQDALKDGYLSAYPREFWDRLRDLKKVWAPFYTLHKIMAGLLDVHEHCGSAQALAVVEKLAGWVDRWTEPLGEAHMQKVLDEEFGGMGEVLCNLWAATGNARYGEIAARFDKQRFLNPLALHRDELQGLHVNTHVPQVIAAVRRYELTGEPRLGDIANYFWQEVTGARCYVNGGTSNDERWLTEPRRLSVELRKSSKTNECCKAYNMLKLTRHLYQRNADPRYFDYYERTLFNHRLGTIHPQTGGTIYYLGLNPGSLKTFSTENETFWCCTGSGVEEFAKLNDSIYFHDEQGLYVNLFIASQLNWAGRGVRVKQTTRFPEEAGTSLVFETAKPQRFQLRVRVPWWAVQGGSVSINGNAVEAFASPGSYLTLARDWKNGDRVDVRFPMSLAVETMPDDESLIAVLYGPLVLVGEMGPVDPAKEQVFGPMGRTTKTHDNPFPELRVDPSKPESWLQPVSGRPLTFRTAGQSQPMTLTPFYQVLDQHYTVYWRALKKG